MEKEGVLAMHLVLWVLIGVAFIGILWWAFNSAKNNEKLKKENKKLKDDVNKLERGILRSDHC